MARRACRYSGCPRWDRFCECLPRYQVAPVRKQAPRSAVRRRPRANSFSFPILPIHCPDYSFALLLGEGRNSRRVGGASRGRHRIRTLDFRDHHIRGLDHRDYLISGFEAKVIYRLVGNRRCDGHAIANVDPHMSGGLAFFQFGNSALNLIASAQFHDEFSSFGATRAFTKTSSAESAEDCRETQGFAATTRSDSQFRKSGARGPESETAQK